MNLRITTHALAVFVATALVVYGLSGFINAQLGLKESVLGEAWKLIALSIALAIITGIAYPHVRGIKRGDQLIVINAQHSHQGFFVNIPLATALENGKKGDKIGMQLLANGSIGEGVIISYGGTLTPPSIKMVETEIRIQENT